MQFLQTKIPDLIHRWSNFSKQLNFGNYLSKNEFKNVIVDGYSPKSNTVVQYMGCKWHGCPDCNVHESETIRQERYAATQRVTNFLEEQRGFNVVEHWECQVKLEMKTDDNLKQFFKKLRLPPMPHHLCQDDLISKIKRGKFFGLVEVDIHTPDHLLQEFEEFPVIFKHAKVSPTDLSPQMQEIAAETGFTRPRATLLTSYSGTKVLLSTPLAKFYLEKGLKITFVYQAVRFMPNKCFEHIGRHLVSLRKAADLTDDQDQSQATLVKLLANCLYGRTLTDKSRYIRSSFATSTEELNLAALRADFLDAEELAPECFQISKKLKVITHDLPTIVGFMILNYAKLSLCRFYYDFLSKYIDRSKWQVMTVDTDSFYIAMSFDFADLRNNVKEHLLKEFDIDVSNFLVMSKEFNRQPNLYKVEYSNGTCMISLAPKCYIISNANNKSKLGLKGVNKATNTHLNLDAFRKVLATKEIQYGINRGLRWVKGNMVFYTQSKRALPYLYIKRTVCSDMINTKPLNL